VTAPRSSCCDRYWTNKLSAIFPEAADDPDIEYIRGLLVEDEALPPRDWRLATFQRWFDAKLKTIEDPDRRQVLELFGRWHPST
jgi:hypothetical protein